MKLTHEQFRDIISGITIVGEDVRLGPTDRRAPRYKTCTHVPVFPWDCPADALSVRVRDISPGGIGILHSRRMALDSQFVVRLPRGENSSNYLLYTVVYWEPLAINLYAIGAQLDRLVEEEELNTRQQEVSQPPIGIFGRLTNAMARMRRTAM